MYICMSTYVYMHIYTARQEVLWICQVSRWSRTKDRIESARPAKFNFAHAKKWGSLSEEGTKKADEHSLLDAPM